MITSLIKPLRAAAGRLLASRGYLLAPIEEWHHVRTMRNVHRGDAIEIENLYRSFVFPDLPRNPARADSLQNLHGTSVGEAIYIVEGLSRAMNVAGDVCEFGCNEGATSRLLASEIAPDDKRLLWLFDSFEGLPAPTEQDRLIDDIAGLGSIERYQGVLLAREDQVRDKLALVKFPENRIRLVKGWLDKTLTSAAVGPLDKIAFAYIDLDFYEPIKISLAFVHGKMPVGGVIVVDDYGFFSEGAKLSVDEFLAAHPGCYDMKLPIEAAGKFCVLTKIAGVSPLRAG